MKISIQRKIKCINKIKEILIKIEIRLILIVFNKIVKKRMNLKKKMKVKT